MGRRPGTGRRHGAGRPRRIGLQETARQQSVRQDGQWTPEERAFLRALDIALDTQDGVEVCASGSASQVLLERMAAAAPPADPHMVERLHRRVLERGAAAGARAVWPGEARPGAAAVGKAPERPVEEGRSHAMEPDGRAGAAMAGQPRRWRAGLRWWQAAAAILVMAGVVMGTNPAVLHAALERIARWVPGAGFVLSDAAGTPVRVLDEPVTVPVQVAGWGRVRLTVEGVLATPQLTEVRLELVSTGGGPSGQPAGEVGNQPGGSGGAGGLAETLMAHEALRLQLPDGTSLAPEAAEWDPADERLVLWFPGLKARVTDVELVLVPVEPGAGPGAVQTPRRPVTIPLTLTEARRAGVAVLEPQAWSPARSGAALGVPRLLLQNDGVLLQLDVRLQESAEGGPPQESAPGAGAGPAGPWRLIHAEGLRLTGPLGTRLELAQVGTSHGRVEAATFDVVARFHGRVPAWARSLELTATRLHVIEPGSAEVRIPLEDIPAQKTIPTDSVARQGRLGRWTVTVTEVTRVDAHSIRLGIDLGPARDGATLRTVSVQGLVLPEGDGAGGKVGEEVGEDGESLDGGFAANAIGGTYDGQNRLVEVWLDFPRPLPRGGVLVVRLTNPTTVVEGPWTVSIPLR